jgi:hypothetical protein
MTTEEMKHAYSIMTFRCSCGNVFTKSVDDVAKTSILRCWNPPEMTMVISTVCDECGQRVVW